MGAKQKEAKPVASKSVPAAMSENGVTDTVTIANGQKVNASGHLYRIDTLSGQTCPTSLVSDDRHVDSV